MKFLYTTLWHFGHELHYKFPVASPVSIYMHWHVNSKFPQYFLFFSPVLWFMETRNRSNNASISIIASFFLPTFATAFLTGSLFFQECCICLSSYEDGAELSALPCNHHFHWTCITKWLRMHATCPLCKYNILKGSDST